MQQNIKDMGVCEANELGLFAQQLTQTFNYLILACKGSMHTCINRDVTQRIKIATQDLGKACIDLVDLAGRLQQQQQQNQNGSDKMLRKELLEQIDLVAKRLNNLIHSFEACAKGWSLNLIVFLHKIKLTKCTIRLSIVMEKKIPKQI